LIVAAVLVGRSLASRCGGGGGQIGMILFSANFTNRLGDSSMRRCSGPLLLFQSFETTAAAQIGPFRHGCCFAILFACLFTNIEEKKGVRRNESELLY
jgi:hypothetical protein